MMKQKNFIRILSLLLCLLMIALFCACGEKEPVGSGSPSTESSPQSDAASDVMSEPESTPTEAMTPETPTTSADDTTAEEGVTPETEPETAPETAGTAPESNAETAPQTGAGTTAKETGKETAKETAKETSKETTKETEKETVTTAVETPAPCAHRNTEIRGKKDATTSSDGYTGDTYCKDCGKKIADGKVTPKLSGVKYTYTLPDGTTLELDESINPREYTMHLYTKRIEHQLEEIEHEILRLCNIERAKEGLAPLEWYEDAYCFTKIRADEIMTLFEHSRLDGRRWDSVYTDANIYLIGTWGENLYRSTGYPVEGYAERAVNAWMNSPGHRANIMNPNFTHMAVAITYEGNTIGAVQNFFG